MHQIELGNASDRARMKTFSFRLGDLDGNAYDIHRTCVIGVIDLYRCHRPGNASDRAHASDRARMKTFSFRLGSSHHHTWKSSYSIEGGFSYRCHRPGNAFNRGVNDLV